MLRKKLAVMLATAMIVVMVAAPAWAAPGNGQGVGQGGGGGDVTHIDNGTKTRTGGGPLNNPHNCFC